MALVLLVIGTVATAVSPGLGGDQPVVAAKDKDDEKTKPDKKEKTDKKEKPEKNEKKDKPGEDDGDHDRGHGNDSEKNNEAVVIVAPNVTPVPAPVTPAATSTPDNAATGSLRIVVLACPGRPADTADWETVCTDPVAQTGFELEARDGDFAGWHRDVAAGDTGDVTIQSLPVGRYELEQLHDDWCRAESDRVDANGDLVIEPAQRTTVWIFNCVTPSLGS
ncbi:MAG: hypothetical protein IT336_09635 [Thermomicrobiales bacterium]|nr:hypothetical protein [Thermomicrobiales bacterium]